MQLIKTIFYTKRSKHIIKSGIINFRHFNTVNVQKSKDEEAENNNKNKTMFIKSDYWSNQKKLLTQKLSDYDKQFDETFVSRLIKIIEKVSHMDEVRKAQAELMIVKDELKLLGDKKRQLIQKIRILRADIQNIQTDILRTKRGTVDIVNLTKQETELLQLERKFQDEFDEIDDIERQQFNELTRVINNKYEKDNNHANTLKMFGFYATIFTTTLTAICSAIGHYYNSSKFNRVSDNINVFQETIAAEINSLKVHIDLLKPTESSTESWGGWTKRHLTNIYRYVNPKRQ